MAPTRRGWRPAIPAAVAGVSLSVCAALAFGAGGAITPPQPPKVTDVVCHVLQSKVDRPFTSARGWLYATRASCVVAPPNFPHFSTT